MLKDIFLYFYCCSGPRQVEINENREIIQKLREAGGIIEKIP